MATLATKRRGVPVAPSQRGGEDKKPDGWEILSDPFPDGLEEVCACLWMVFRDLQRWMDTAEHKRGWMFGERNHEWRARMLRAMRTAPGLTPALRAFLRLRAEPATVPAAELGAACLGVWTWAESESLSGTAAHFAETAAYLAPENPAYATASGFACRRNAWYERALMWYQRGFRLAVRSKNRIEAVRGLLGCGAVYEVTERYDDARELYKQAAARALRTNKRRMAGVAHHYLFALEVEHGRFEAGLEQVCEALNLYPIYDRRVPYLAHDFAFLLVRKRYFVSAAQLLEKVALAITKPDERVLVEGVIARAAGALNEYGRYRAAVTYVLETSSVYPQYAPASFESLAYGARSVGEWDDAAQYAATAERLASARQDYARARNTADLLRDIQKRTPPEKENILPCPDSVDPIARMFTVRLRRWLAPDRRGTEASAAASTVSDVERRQL